jgi:hypothetical protein
MIKNYDKKEDMMRDLTNIFASLPFTKGRISLSHRTDMFSTITDLRIKITKDYEQT